MNSVFDDNFKKYSHRIDSAHRAEYQKYKTKSDSLHNVQYQNQLERAILVDTAKDTYYGTVFSGIAVSVTIVILFFGINVLRTRRDARRQIKEIASGAKTSLEAQHQSYADAFEVMKTTAVEFQKQIQQDLEEKLTSAKEKLIAIETGGDATMQQKLEDVIKEIERLSKRNDANNELLIGKVKEYPIHSATSYVITCKNPSCKTSFVYNPPEQSSAMLKKLFKNYPDSKSQFMAKCPKCGTLNELPITTP